ncbi:unnamed protein product [Diabrotica balteata]|uniref:Protein FAM161A n=1 Tax=Diabrotica balteata TaxID=107213 RepID=A0A9N9T879_DIABA|nr:unnamed protein product [Diabrotica balteata]
MYNHTSSVYNNSCVKVPRNPIIGLPLPSYEQNYKYLIENQDRALNINLMETKKYLDKETTKSFVEFFTNIPDYDEIHHLSNKEFYEKLENLREKKKLFEENLHKEIKFDPKNSEAIEEYKKQKLGANKSKEKKKPTIKPSNRATRVKETLNPILTPDIDSEFSDREERKEKKKSSLKPYFNHLSKNLHPAITPDLDSEYSDKDILNKPPSRRSVRIETPSDRFSNDETPEPFFRSKSRANISSNNFKRSASLTGWDDWRSKSRTQFSSLDLKTRNNGYSDYNFKPNSSYSSQNFRSGNLTDYEDLKSRSGGNYLKSTGNLSHYEDYKPFSDFKNTKVNCEDLNLKSKTNYEATNNKSKSSELKSIDNSDADGLRPKSRANDLKTSGNLTDWEDLSIENLNLNSVSNSPEPLQTRSAPTSPVKSNPKNDWTGEITIPKPFQMTVRDEENKIVEELFFKMKKPKDDKPEMFKANDVPVESQIPLFDKIMADQQRRSFVSKQKRKAALRASMRPFSFTKRDEEIQELTRELSKSSPNLYIDPPLKIKKFKAKPIPKNLFSNYIYRKMHEDEYYRALQKKIRAEELLKAASLPPSMAKRERSKPKLNVCPRSFSNLSTEEKVIKKSKFVPNYRAYQDKFEKELEDMKNEFISTSPRPFKLKTSKRARRHLRQSSASSKTSSSKTATPCSFDMSSINTSNLAAILRIQSARQKIEMEMIRALDEAQRRDEARWREKLFRKKPIWHNLAYNHEDDLAIRLQLRRDEEKLRKEEHKMRMSLMYGRVQKQPTLFERQSQMKYPVTREELEDQLREMYGKKNESIRSISNLSGKKSVVGINFSKSNPADCSFNIDLDDIESKEKESLEEKEKCDCLSDDIDNDPDSKLV